MKKCLLFIILVLAIAFWYSYADAKVFYDSTIDGYSDLVCYKTYSNNGSCIFSFTTTGERSATTTPINVDFYGSTYRNDGNPDASPEWFFGKDLSCSESDDGCFRWNGATTKAYSSTGLHTNILSNELLSFADGSILSGQTYNFKFDICFSCGGSISIYGKGGTPYLKIYDATPDLPPNTTSRIDSISVSTSTNTVNLTGYWNATTTSGVYEQLEFYQINTILGQEDYFTVNATTSGAFNIDFDYRNVATPYTGTTTKPITANTTFYANLYEKNNAYYNPFGDYDIRYETLLDATTTMLVASTTDYFNISTSTIVDYPEYECSITSLTGCFKNALIWTFYPSQKTIGRYYALVEVIQRKPPIGYFYITKNAIISLSASSTSAFNITIPAHLKTYIFSPLDTGLAGLAWIFFVFAFYKRLKDLKI